MLACQIGRKFKYAVLSFLAALSVLNSFAYAQSEMDNVTIVCPIEGNTFVYRLIQPPRGHLIEDRDYCLRVVPDITSFKTAGLYPARLADCQKCGLAAPPDSPIWNAGGEFAKWYAETFAEAMMRGSRALRPSWESFERYARSLESQRADERDVALAWLDASFCIRTGFWEEHPGWATFGNEAVAELADVTPLEVPFPSPRVLYEESIEIPAYFHDLFFNARRAGPALGVLGCYWLARGETARVQNAINSLAEIEHSLGSNLAGKGPKLMREISESGILEKMREYQTNAAVSFELALERGQILSSEIPLVYFHLGELYRRTGELKNAERYYKLAHSNHAASEKIKEKSKTGLELIALDEALYEELIAFVTADFIDELPIDAVAEEIEPIQETPGEISEPKYNIGSAIEVGKPNKPKK